MRTLWQDFRYSLRLMAKNPAFTAIIILTLAFGIGANTAIFTVVEAALLRGLPYRDAEQLVHLWETKPQGVFTQREASHPDFLDWRKNDVFTGLAGYVGGTLALAGGEAPERVQGMGVTANFFEVLGVEPQLGRAFRVGEDEPGAERTVLLTHASWQRRFGGDAGILGRTIEMSGAGFTVIGVLPESFHFAPGGSSEMWFTWRPGEAQQSRRFMHWVRVIGRLKPGIDLKQAEAAMGVIAGRIAAEHADSHTGTGIRLVGLQEQFTGPVRPLLVALLAAVGVVLLIACANIANLLLARAASRAREIAVRAALGATRARLIRQLMVESLVLATAGGLIGLLFAQWGVDVLIAAIPESRLSMMPFLRNLHLDARILAFTGGLSIAVGVLFGLAPAMQATRASLVEVIKGGGRSATLSGKQRLRNLLVVAEIALSFVLLVSAGLMLQSLGRLLAVDPGFDPRNVLTLRVALPPAQYDTIEKVNSFHDRLAARLSTIPGVENTAQIDILPLVGGNTTRFFVAGEGSRRDESPEVNIRQANESYFRTMKTPVLQGREFGAGDNGQSPRVVVINRMLAGRVFAGRNPIGQRIVFTHDEATTYEIVGIVGDERVNGIDAEAPPVVYYPSRQELSRMTNIVIRTKGDPREALGAVRREALGIDKNISIYAVRTMEEMIAEAPGTFARRYPAMLLGLFALLALVLAAVGVYGVISYAVTQQTQEFGIRIALGAAPGDILRLVMGSGMRLAAGGIAIGAAAAFGLTRLLSSLLYGIAPHDPATFGALALLLAAVAFIACYLPARRAMRVDPLTALRYE